MPVTIRPEIAIRAELRKSVKNVLELNEKLESVIAIKPKQPSGVFHGKIDHSPPPWASSVANCILDLHADSREMEEWLRVSLELPYRHRGGSSANTRKALESVIRLAETVDDHVVKEYTRKLDRWCKRALVALGIIEAPGRIPRLPGENEPACPWCANHTLRMFPVAGLIKCVTPKCFDEEGRKPEARMEYSPYVGDFVLVWQDQRGN